MNSKFLVRWLFIIPVVLRGLGKLVLYLFGIGLGVSGRTGKWIGGLWVRLPHFVQNVLTGSLIVLIFVPVSFWWFRYGVWIDLAAPILAMAVHQAFANWEESRSHPHAAQGQATA